VYKQAVAEEGENLAALRIGRDDEEEPRSWRRRALKWAAALLAAAAALGWWLRPRPEPVRVFVVSRADPTDRRTVLNASGYVAARRQATVSSKITARIVEVLIEEGQQVKQGQVLARLDDANVRRNLELAQAQVSEAQKQADEARARLDQARKEWRRVSRLTKEGVSTPSDLDRAKAELDAWQARLDAANRAIEVARKQVAVWEQQIEDTVIRAPFDGVVTTKNAQPGEMISPVSAGGGYTRTGICTIVDMASREIEVDVNESYIHRVFEGQPVIARLDAYPDWPIPGKVIAVVPTADRQKSTIKVRIAFDKLDPRVLPEMSIRVAFLKRAKPGEKLAPFYIPAEAVGRTGGARWVWKIVDGKVRRTPIQCGPEEDGEVGVELGLEEGDRIVAGGLDRLREGMRVTERKSS